jgi:hypothetical protein
MIDYFLTIQPKQGEEELTQVLINFGKYSESESEIDDYQVTMDLRLKGEDSVAKLEKLALEKAQNLFIDLANFCKKLKKDK